MCSAGLKLPCQLLGRVASDPVRSCVVSKGLSHFPVLAAEVCEISIVLISSEFGSGLEYIVSISYCRKIFFFHLQRSMLNCILVEG